MKSDWLEAMLTPSAARISAPWDEAASNSELKGMPSAVASAQSVSTLGFPLPPSSWERVDLANPAFAASADRLICASSRSRRMAAAMMAVGVMDPL